ncbi:hypothetical protein Bhyg_12904 [Pseudolycoriella hygida]|uniref:Uncharacterized protein n=1 Tax=Pseudolycoriella hygida TaxID=35572 RepID=A0A9Q0RZS8_9DIPT|nr:hypothetical protein Bhyg_12904 [Pseudolycoriella hygida]
MLNMADEIDKRTTRSLIQKKSNETDILVLLKGVSAKLDQNQKELKNLDIKFDKSISDITCKLEQESICIRDDFHDISKYMTTNLLISVKKFKFSLCELIESKLILKTTTELND